MIGLRTGAWTVKITNNVGHTRLVAHEGSQVHGLLGVILKTRLRSLFLPLQVLLRTLGKDLTFPRWRAARFLGRKPREP